MTSREKILSTVKANKPLAESELPIVPDYTQALSIEESIALFTQNLADNKAVLYTFSSDEELSSLIVSQWPDHRHIHAPMLPYLHNSPGTVAASSQLDIAVVKGRLGVANNGAIWVKDEDLEHRSVPFLTKYLVILLDANDIVYNLHEAYVRLSSEDFDYGVWISGPSKTGDIEQALVIGAHGPLEMMVGLKV